MKRVIWKYPLLITDLQVVRLPIGAQILNIKMQIGKDAQYQPMLWALVDPLAETEQREIICKGTGQAFNVEGDHAPLVYINTVEEENGLIFHYFEQEKSI